MIAAPNHSKIKNTVQVVSRGDQNSKCQAADFVAARCDDELNRRKRKSHCFSGRQSPIVFGLKSTLCSVRLSSIDQQSMANQADSSGYCS